MAPIITQWSDLDSVYEASDANTGKFLYTTFSVIDDNDAFYFGQLIVRKLKITLEEFTAALELIPDEDLFPEFPLDAHLTLAPNELDVDAFYIKRPRLRKYEEYKEDGDLSTIPTLVLDEAHALQIVSQQPHPGIIGYHGCRVRRGRITGLVLDKHPHNLKEYIKNGIGEIDDKEAFMNALEAAVRYLHSLGLAHNGTCFWDIASSCFLSLRKTYPNSKQALTRVARHQSSQHPS
jgi:serine/threonine protein kinase